MVSVRVEGLREFDRALGRADKDARKRLRAWEKDAVEIVASEARHIAEAKGLRRSGDLVRGIRPFANQSGAGVRSTAKHRGYRYPKRLEFEGRNGARYGPRASLLPAADVKGPEVVRKADGLLDRVVDDLTH